MHTIGTIAAFLSNPFGALLATMAAVGAWNLIPRRVRRAAARTARRAVRRRIRRWTRQPAPRRVSARKMSS